jgi:hypothetical protein
MIDGWHVVGYNRPAGQSPTDRAGLDVQQPADQLIPVTPE